MNFIMISKNFFGTTLNGEIVHCYTIKNGGLVAKILNFGATLQSLKIPASGTDIDVVLGYDTVCEYERNEGYLGAVIGRNANRIKNGKFTLNGTNYTLNINNGINNLHGGNVGFSHKVWEVENFNENENSITLCLISPSGDEGFPGTLKTKVTYTLTNTALHVEYFASTDATTVCNLTNHAYFNLNGEGSDGALDVLLYVNALSYTPIDSDLNTTGESKSVIGSPFDFTGKKLINKDINENNVQLKYMQGYDVNFALSGEGYRLVATCENQNNGVILNVYKEGLQLYTANFLDTVGKGGKKYARRSALCLETQSFPGAINQPNFKSVVLNPNENYYSKTTYEFIIKEA